MSKLLSQVAAVANGFVDDARNFQDLLAIMGEVSTLTFESFIESGGHISTVIGLATAAQAMVLQSAAKVDSTSDWSTIQLHLKSIIAAKVDAALAKA